LHTWLGAFGLGALAFVGACGLESGEPETAELASASTVSSFITGSCTTAVVIGLSKQIATEIGCLNPSSLVRFAAGSGITITSNAVLPFLAANAKADLQQVGNVQINSAFRTIAQQFLLVQWHNQGPTTRAVARSTSRTSARASPRWRTITGRTMCRAIRCTSIT
jgi:hypothetical protein